jgi:hypothetical protein
MNLTDELSKNQITLLVIPSNKYGDTVINNAKELSKKSVCYITLNKTYMSLKEIFQKNNVNTKNLLFIDGICQTIKKVPNDINECYFVSSPAALTELSLVITKFLKHNFDYLIFDSLTSLIVYSKKGPISKFLSSIINKIRETNTKAVFYSLGTKEEPLIKESSMFVDKILQLD